MRRIEQRVLGVGDLEFAHVERPLDADDRRRILVGLARAVRSAHHELAGRNQGHLERQPLGQFDFQFRLQASCLLAPLGFGRVKGPVGAGGRSRRPRRQRRRGDIGDLLGRQFRDRLGILRPIGEPRPHLQPPSFHRRMAAAMLVPRAVIGNVQVDPGHQPVPRLGVQLDVVMAFLQQLNQLADRSVVLQRLLQVIIALRARTAHERVQGDVRGREIAPAWLGLGCEIRQRPAVVLTLTVVAADAVAVQHRLDLAFEAESAHRAVPGRDRGRPRLAGVPVLRRRAGVLRFVAAHARQHFARHGRKPAAHDLQRPALLVQRLDGNRQVGRHLEDRGAVRSDGHGPVDHPHVPRSVDADVNVAAHARIGVVVRVHPEFLHRPARHVPQAFAAIDVGQVNGGLVLGQIDAVRYHRRPFHLLHGNRLEQCVTGLFLQQQHVVKHIHQVQPPRRRGGGLARDEEVLVIQGERMKELGPRAFHQPIADDGINLLFVSRNPLHGPVRFSPSVGRVEQHQLAHPRHTVVAGDHGDDLRRIVGNGPRVENRIGPHGIAGIVLHLPRAVRVHLEQQPREVMRQVGVFPAAVQQAAVVQHGGAPVVVLIETQLADAAAVRIHQAQVGDRVAAAHAGHAGKAARRGKYDTLIRQVAGVVVVDVRRIVRRDLPQAAGRAVSADLPDLPAAILAGHREQHLAGVEVQIDIADELAAGRLVQRRHASLRPDGREHGDLVVVAVPRQGAVALPVLRQAQAVGFAADQQQLVEAQQRIGQQRVLAELVGVAHDTRRSVRGRLVAPCQSRLEVAHTMLQLVQPLDKLRRAWVPRPERAAQVLDRPAQSGQVDRFHLGGPVAEQAHAFVQFQPAEIVGRDFRARQLLELALHQPRIAAQFPQRLLDHLLRQVRRRGGTQPLPVPAARQVPPHPTGLQGVVGFQLVPHRRVGQLAEPEIETVSPAVVVNFEQQTVLARLERQVDAILIGSRTAGDVVGMHLAAVQPQLAAVVAAEAGFHGCGRRDFHGAKQVRRGAVAAVQHVDLAVGPFRVRTPQRLAVRRFGVQVHALLREQNVRERAGFQRAGRAPVAKFRLLRRELLDDRHPRGQHRLGPTRPLDIAVGRGFGGLDRDKARSTGQAEYPNARPSPRPQQGTIRHLHILR